jgi:hypothetical protein
MAIESSTLQAWSDIHALASRRQWLFRGQSHAKWNLRTSLERIFDREAIPFGKRSDLEAELLRDFRRAYHQYGFHVPAPDAHLEWLSLMQHHGAPTRLLDFSYSVYVAAYFALEHAEDEDCAVFAVNGPWAVNQSIAALKTKGKDDLEKHTGRTTREVEKEAYDALFTEPFAKCAYPVNPFRLNDRLRIQKGLFVMPGDARIGFMQNLEALPGHDSGENFVKVIIPAKMKRQALEHLFYMNVSRTSLFPGLDGYASSLGIYHPAFNQEDWPVT